MHTTLFNIFLTGGIYRYDNNSYVYSLFFLNHFVVLIAAIFGTIAHLYPAKINQSSIIIKMAHRRATTMLDGSNSLTYEC